MYTHRLYECINGNVFLLPFHVIGNLTSVQVKRISFTVSFSCWIFFIQKKCVLQGQRHCIFILIMGRLSLCQSLTRGISQKSMILASLGTAVCYNVEVSKFIFTSNSTNVNVYLRSVEG